MQLFKKAIFILRNRPRQLWSHARSYFLFARTRILGKWLFTEAQGYFLEPNVRVQRLACLSADSGGARIEVREGSVIYENARLSAHGQGRIRVGRQCVLGDIRISTRAQVTFGDRCVTSWGVFIQDFDSHPIDPDLRALQIGSICEGFEPRFDSSRKSDLSHLSTEERKRLSAWQFPSEAIEIGNGVWIGAQVTILKGAKIGNGSLVAAGAVVPRGQYPDRAILAGNPAKVIKVL